MDSGNSTGSLQSSSTNGGDDESYDSRADSSSISAFLNPPPPPPPTTTTPHHTFDHHFSLSNYPTHTLDPTHTQKPPNPNPLLNLDMVWSNSNSKSIRSDPTPPDLLLPTSGFLSPNISTNFNQQSLTSFNNHFPPNITENINTTTTTTNNNNSIPVRNPKKRSRASRRAPTTVLTTDTTNFRAMVQEFTGIPAPPFTSVSPFSRTRLDLFTAVPPSSSSSFKPDPPPYLLRPFPHKPFLNSEATVSVPTPVPDVAVTTSNYQNLLNMGMGMGMQVQNPIFNLQSLLQQPKIGSNSNGVLEDQLGLGSTSTTTNSMVGIRTNNNDLLGLDFNGDHKENNVGATTTRTEGMVESWICSSE